MPERETRLLVLDDNVNYETNYYRLHKGLVLRFVLAPNLQSHDVRLSCNHPQRRASLQFRRDRFLDVSWHNPTGRWFDESERYADVEVHSAGSFQFKIEYEKIENGDVKKVVKRGYFVVDPTLYLTKDTSLPFDAICCHTVLSKNLGPFTYWKDKLKVSKATGYNMIHFTPVQQLGGSQSAYSIADQLRSNPNFQIGRSPVLKRLKTSGHFGDVGRVLEMEEGLKRIGDLVENVRRDWGILSITDVVWNHTSNDTPWLREHPEAAYNLVNSPHLRPAFALDQKLHEFAVEIGDGKWEAEGVPPLVRTDDELRAIVSLLHRKIVPETRLWEYYAVDYDRITDEFKAVLSREDAPKPDDPNRENVQLVVIQDPEYRRFGSTVDIDVAVKLFNISKPYCVDEGKRINMCCFDLRQKLESLCNYIRYYVVQDHVNAAIANVEATVRYEHLESHGPKQEKVDRDHPLAPKYFTNLRGDESLSNADVEGDAGRYVIAHNGWVMNADPLANFASSTSNVYVRRELLAWGDSCKLNYGDKPSDSPWLWAHMEEYTKITARLFHGFRIDNCHNTPIHVAEHLLDVARHIRPDLYVIAELFTNSEYTDNVFVNRLGINSLIREAMSAYDPHDLGRLVYRYGGEPVGSFMHPSVRPLNSCVAHAIFMDATHDNQTQIESRTVYNVLPNTALVAMACCASGSTKGYDELVPHHIHVVNEKREFTSWSDVAPEVDEASYVTTSNGIIEGKRALNRLHAWMGEEGYNQVFVDQVTEHVIAVTRHRPSTHESVILVAHTVFWSPRDHYVATESNAGHTGYVPPLCVQGEIEEVIFEGTLLKCDSACDFARDSRRVNGLKSHRLSFREHVSLADSKMCQLDEAKSTSDTQEVRFVHFPPGTIVAIKTHLFPGASDSVRLLRTQLGLSMPAVSDASLSSSESWFGEHFNVLLSRLTLSDLNRILYRCDAEEREDGCGGVYGLASGSLPYAGIEGVMSVLAGVHLRNDQGHPICNNLRDGDWLIDFTSNRLLLHSRTKEIGKVLEKMFTLLKRLPRYLIPAYFSALLTKMNQKLQQRAWESMSTFVSRGSTFVKELARGSVQLCGHLPSSPLPPLSPKAIVGASGEEPATLAAGLPHFATGYMRCWGRDTFIALRGLLLTTGRYKEARNIILGFAGCLRHGLIPNLLAGGRGARYNCRDAVWWWLQSIRDYCTIVPKGVELLNAPVSRLFPADDSEPQPAGKVDMPLCQVMQEALQRHAMGIAFRERNAGSSLDQNMKPEGFDVSAGIDWKTGFVYGGSAFNCGTWMDKVGESDQAGNRGVPATPRDGSAVELVGLCKSVVHWLTKVSADGLYKDKGVMTDIEGLGERLVTWSQWDKLIQESFERHFWIPDADMDVSHIEDATFIHRRTMYRDTVGATQRFADFQLRPNFPIAMTVAPELFVPEHAWKALDMVETTLLGKLGMATLDPKDWAYRGVYDNGQDSNIFETARGFNYHQGPEWLWVTGYFLRAKLHFSQVVDGGSHASETIRLIHHVVARHREALESSQWKGLVELTNVGGLECKDSCAVQAWSMSCMLDVLYDVGSIKMRP